MVSAGQSDGGRRHRYDRSVDPRLTQTARLLALRGRREFDPAIARDVDGLLRSVKRSGGAISRARTIWDQVVPTELATKTRLESLRAGTLTVSADSSAALYEIDRLLRGSLRETLLVKSGGDIAKVRTRLATAQRPPASRGGPSATERPDSPDGSW